MKAYEKQYIGDGIYVSFDGYQIELSTQRWGGGEDKIYLEPGVWYSLVRYVESLKQ